MAPTKKSTASKTPNPSYVQATTLARSEINPDPPSDETSGSSRSHMSMRANIDPGAPLRSTLICYPEGAEIPDHEDEEFRGNDLTMNEIIENSRLINLENRKSTTDNRQAPTDSGRDVSERIRKRVPIADEDHSVVGDQSDGEDTHITRSTPVHLSDLEIEHLANLRSLRDDYNRRVSQLENLQLTTAGHGEFRQRTSVNDAPLSLLPGTDILQMGAVIPETRTQKRKASEINDDEPEVQKVYNFDKPVVLDDTVNETTALAYVRYWRKPQNRTLKTPWDQTILETAVNRIRLRLNNCLFNDLVTDDVRTNWPLNDNMEVVSTNLENAEIINIIFGKPANEGGAQSNLEQLCKNHLLRFHMDNEIIEEDSLTAYQRIISDYKLKIKPDLEEDHVLAEILGEKLPRNSGMKK